MFVFFLNFFVRNLVVEMLVYLVFIMIIFCFVIDNLFFNIVSSKIVIMINKYIID